MIYHEDEGPGRVIEVEGTLLQLSERNTPPLFGIGLISQIARADLEKVAKEQAGQGRGVHGRLVGRFGWRGQSWHLGQFVRGACAVELGLQVKHHPQAADPSVAPGVGMHIAWGEVDLTEQQCDQMTEFVSALPAPRRLRGTDPADVASIRHGSEAFESVGCTDCHRPTLGKIDGIYSDLLVHDMGLALIDPSPARRCVRRGAAPTRRSPITAAVRFSPSRNWPPGGIGRRRRCGACAIRALTCTTGRAATVAEAIASHGGEADHSLKRYNNLSSHKQQELLRFLDTLAAPDPARLPRPTEVALPLAAK